MDELYDIIETVVRDELMLRPSQSRDSVAHAIARETLRRMREAHIKVGYKYSSSSDDENDEDDEDDEIC